MVAVLTTWLAFACGGESSDEDNAPAGSCAVGAAYCVDYLGAAWDATNAEIQCALFSSGLLSELALNASYEVDGCAANATAECTGVDGMPGEDDSEIAIFFYEDPPIEAAETLCMEAGGTYNRF